MSVVTAAGEPTALSAAKHPELLRIGQHDVLRWDSDTGPQLTALLPDPIGDRLLAGMVFHLARCGSTLLACLLDAVPGTHVLREPAAVNMTVARKDLPPAERSSLLRRVVATYGAAAASDPHGLVLKCSSWNLLHAGHLLAAFPDTPAVLVVRDPLEVLVSLTERPPGWLTSAGIDREEVVATVIAGYLDAAPRLLGQRWLVVHYEDLPGAVASVAEHLGLEPPDPERVAEVAAIDSKHEGRPWRPDSATKRAAAPRSLRDACARHTQPAYDRLIAATGG